MANLYKIKNLCCDFFIVLADDETEAVTKYEAWVTDSGLSLDDYQVVETLLFADNTSYPIFIP